MSKLACPIAVLALVATIVPPLLFLWQLMDEESMKSIMLGASAVWFAAAPFWLREK